MSLTDALAVLGATLGTASFLWGLESFRRSGARIRVRALYCDGELDLVVVNAGRAADAVVHVFLGGARVGDGVELNSHINRRLTLPLSPATPFSVEAARPLLVRVALASIHRPAEVVTLGSAAGAGRCEGRFGCRPRCRCRPGPRAVPWWRVVR
jgi:hypothetical protein